MDTKDRLLGGVWTLSDFAGFRKVQNITRSEEYSKSSCLVNASFDSACAHCWLLSIFRVCAWLCECSFLHILINKSLSTSGSKNRHGPVVECSRSPVALFAFFFISNKFHINSFLWSTSDFHMANWLSLSLSLHPANRDSTEPRWRNACGNENISPTSNTCNACWREFFAIPRYRSWALFSAILTTLISFLGILMN